MCRGRSVKPLPPYRVSVYNRAAQQSVGDFYTNQIPQRGELISFYGGYTRPEDAYHRWGTWRVDEVLWEMAHVGSVRWTEIARETGIYDSAAFCTAVEVHVWPAEGPHFYKTPKWAKAARAPEDDEEEEAPEVDR